MNNKKKLIISIICIFLLTGCTTNLKDENKNIVKNPDTGQAITENIICKPTSKDVIKIYNKHDVDINKLPDCENFNPISNYEGLWTSLFVKPLAWVILKIGSFLNSYGLSIIITCLLIRIILMPITRKTAVQSELIKKAQPELEKLEKKYKGKDSQEDQNRKAQEMLLIYQKYKINPISGCLLSFIQLPLLFAFLEAITRTPALFENNFLVFQMGTTPWVGIVEQNNYWYILLIILIIGTTLLSFRKMLKEQSGPTAKQMKYTVYFMLIMIVVASFSLPAALGIYWITSSIFTVVQNYYVEKKEGQKK